MSTSTILIVDDEPQIRRVMRTTLSSNGYTVIEARSGEEALEIMRKERPELVLLDVNMNPVAQVNYGTGRDVSSESVSDANTPLQIEYHNDSNIVVPIGQ